MKKLHIIALATLLAGLSHLIFQSYTHMGMHFYFIGFILVGLIQILLSIAIWRGNLTPPVFWLTGLVNGGATVFWLLTRTMSAPFMPGVEHVSAVGITIIALQVLSIVFLALERKSLLYFIYIILGGAVLGFGSHTGAMAMERAFPEMKVAGHHHHGHCKPGACTAHTSVVGDASKHMTPQINTHDHDTHDDH